MLSKSIDSAPLFMHIPPPMKVLKGRFIFLYLLVVLPLLTLGLAGCSTTDYQAAMLPPSGVENLTNLPPIQVGETVTILFSGLPMSLDPQEKQVNDDGSITLPDIGRIQAAGKTPGDLETYIHDRYVPSIYTHLGVSVKTTSDRVYFVRGEVKSPGRIIYVGPITVTKAITSAGDFTDFANRKRVLLIRSNGPRFKLNCDKILNGDLPDPPVFPGDQIEIKRRLF
jgi:protein involved in polysaccharide export with SLBB domain